MKKITLLFLLMTNFIFSQSFTNHIIDNASADALDNFVIDLDNDGDKDIIGVAYTGDEVSWYENDGSQNFTKHSIATSIDGAIYVTAADIDADGDIDVVVNAYNIGKTYLFVNNGSQVFTSQVIDVLASGSNYNSIADLNGDGHLDIVSTNLDANELLWYEHDGMLGFLEHSIDIISGANSVETVDFNNDGFLDLLVTAYNGDEIAWYLNNGTGTFLKYSIDTAAQGALTAFPIDFDMDGDMDFIASLSGRLLPTGGDEIAWYENDGSENFTKHSVDSSSDYAAFAQAGDFDADGDLDIIGAATNSNELRWYESDGATPPTFTTHIITEATGDNYSLTITDLDNDGDLDIIDANPGNNQIRWLESPFIINIPDNNFENYLETHDATGSIVPLGDSQSLGDGIINNLVPLVKIKDLTSLNISSQSIVDITGIEYFESLNWFQCHHNSITDIDVSKNLNLIQIFCGFNLISSLDLSQNINLAQFNCVQNPNLETLNIQNGNNTNISDTFFSSYATPLLTCILVDDAAYSTSTWTTNDATIWGDGVDSKNFSDTFCCTRTTTWNGTTWNNGIPTDGTLAAIIDDTYSVNINSSIHACTLEITTNGWLEIENNQNIIIENDIKNNGAIIVEKGGSVIQIDNMATVTGDPYGFDVEVITTPMLDPRYTYFSSPTQASTINDFTSWAQMNRIYAFNGGTTQAWIASGSTDTMTPGKGYIVRPSGNSPYATAQNFTTNFSSPFNNGVITHPLSFNTGGTDDDNELVGNPYPSAVDAATLLSSNTSANAFYFWSHSEGGSWATEEYKLWNGLGSVNGAPASIATGQGFFVTANANGTFTFDNSMRVSSNNDFLRPPTNDLDKVWINLLSNTNVRSQILMGFNPICTDGFDPQYDAARSNSGSTVSLYSSGIGPNTSNLAIQARGLLTGTSTTIPLGLTTTDSNITNLSMSIDHLEQLADQDIYLIDHLLNITHNLKAATYNFSISNNTGVLDTRFEILFSRNSLTTNENLLNNNRLILTNQSENQIHVKISNGKLISNFQVFDVLGKLLIDINPASTEFTIDTHLNQGTILFIKATLESGQVISKKFIKF